MDRDKIINLDRGFSIDAFCQVSVHLVMRFQRRRFFVEIDQSETIIACGSHVCKCIGTKLAIFITGFLSFGSFGQAVSEEKMF
jgi:hypothetical protein